MTACNLAISSDLVAKDCATWPVLDQERWKDLFDPARNWAGRRGSGRNSTKSGGFTVFTWWIWPWPDVP
jgi:hypothetical protein